MAGASQNGEIMQRILWIRHGETEWNRERRIMGREEIGLNDAGREQSRSLATALQPYALDAIISSPILRARETAAIIAEPHQLEVQCDERLWEIDYGDWVGKTFDEIRAKPG